LYDQILTYVIKYVLENRVCQYLFCLIGLILGGHLIPCGNCGNRGNCGNWVIPA
jgi:hypothetical protein